MPENLPSGDSVTLIERLWERGRSFGKVNRGELPYTAETQDLFHEAAARLAVLELRESDRQSSESVCRWCGHAQDRHFNRGGKYTCADCKDCPGFYATSRGLGSASAPLLEQAETRVYTNELDALEALITEGLPAEEMQAAAWVLVQRVRGLHDDLKRVAKEASYPLERLAFYADAHATEPLASATDASGVLQEEPPSPSVEAHPEPRKEQRDV